MSSLVAMANSMPSSSGGSGGGGGDVATPGRPRAAADGGGASTTATDASGLTKKQRKRRRKKAAAKLKRDAERAAAAACAVQSTTNGAGVTAGPLTNQKTVRGEPQGRHNRSTFSSHDALKSDLLSQGYKDADVDAATERMWELDLPYDDPDEVERFLLRSRGIVAKSSAGSDTPPILVESPVSTVGTAGAPSASARAGGAVEEAVEETKDDGLPGEDDGGLVGGTASGGLDAAAAAFAWPTSMDGGDAPPRPRTFSHPRPSPTTAATSITTKRKTTNTAMGFSEKLEMVANSDNLEDGIFALSEWVTRAAKPPEVRHIFCAYVYYM